MVDASPRLTPLQIPLLENGDRLNRYEFERRHSAMPDLKKAELVEGVVCMPTERRFRSHSQPHGNIMGWLWTYKVATPGVELGDTPTVRLDLDNAPQPDAVLMIEADRGGQTSLGKDDYIEGVPELVAEIATASMDLGDKRRAYCRNGVKEYLVWQVFERRIDWFYLESGEYVSLPVDEAGVVRSQVFPGLWLAVEDLLADNMPRVLAVLQAGLASEEHADFARRLSQES